MADQLLIAVPSKGRLMNDTLARFAQAGLEITRIGSERGYFGKIESLDTAEVQFASASEIAGHLRHGRVHFGVTGQDLVHENIPAFHRDVEFICPLGFGHADLIVAVPDWWLDVRTVSQLEEVGRQFRATHGRRMRVATKYLNTARRFFASAGLSTYRLVESLGATEATPAAGTAELIVDITTTGNTLRANNLRMLDDGVILRSQANLVASNTADWSGDVASARALVLERFQAL
ncbi:MAG: ATP phosphoribosyltransferase [Pseudomonadota bacterium]